LFGGDASDSRAEAAEAAGPAEAGEPGETEADERAYELDLLRAEQSRLDDLRQRQLRYADRAWTPPSQGGERRADDGGSGEET